MVYVRRHLYPNEHKPPGEGDAIDNHLKGASVCLGNKRLGIEILRSDVISQVYGALLPPQ